MQDTLRNRFAGLKSDLDSLSDAVEPPSTTLQIIRSSQQERDWQRLLFYYLSPNESHGLDRDFLEYLLTKLESREDLDFGFSRLDLSEVEVKQEVTISGGRRPDAVIWVSEEWFICWELKVNATESEDQTRDYVKAKSFQSIELEKKNIPENCRHYIYLTPDNASSPEADEFVPISWRWVADQIQTFLAESQGKYPARTVVQLETFIGTIRSEMMTTDYQESQKEKAELYFEYYDEIAEARNAFENEWDEFVDSWGTRLIQRLDNAEVVEIAEMPSSIKVVDVSEETNKNRRWLFHQGTGDWWGICKENWHKRTDDLSTIYQRRDDQKEVGIRFFNRAEKHRERAIEDGELAISFWHLSSNDDEFISDFNNNLQDRITDIELSPAIEYTGAKTKPLKARYDIPLQKYENFFDAYTVGLKRAFVDIALNNSPLIELLDNIYKRSINIYRE